MSSAVAIGADNHIAGFALAGVTLYPASNDDAVRQAWDSLGDDVALVILTAAAAHALDLAAAESAAHGAQPLCVVMPS